MWPGWRRCVTRGGPWGFRNSWHSQLALSFCLRIAVSTRMFLVSALAPCPLAYCHLLHRNGQGLTLWNWKQAPKLSALFYMFLRLWFFVTAIEKKLRLVIFIIFELVFKLAFPFSNSNIFFCLLRSSLIFGGLYRCLIYDWVLSTYWFLSHWSVRSLWIDLCQHHEHLILVHVPLDQVRVSELGCLKQKLLFPWLRVAMILGINLYFYLGN